MRLLALIKSIIVTVLFPFTVLALGPVAILMHDLFNRRKIDDAIVSFWARLCCWMAGARVMVEGRENLPQQGCLLLFNHSSFFDVFALAGYIPELRFGAKAELFKIPVFAHAMKAMGTLPIARNNREEVFKIYEDARVRFAKGQKFALSPEGGRFYGEQLSPFKAGPFVFAMSAGVPLVPVVVTGAYEVLPKGAILFNKDRLTRTIRIQILKPVSTEGVKPEDRRALQSEIYETMNRVWMNSQSSIR